MQSRRVRAGVVLLLAVVALGAAGAAVDTTGSGGGSSGLGEGSSSGMGGGERPGLDFEDTPIEPLIPGEILPMLIGVLAVGGIVAAVVATVLAVVNWDWERFVAFVKSAGPRIAMVVVMFGIMYLVLGLFDFSRGGGSTGAFGGQAEGVSETASETGVSIPPVVGAGIVVVVVLLLLLVARSGDDEDPSAPTVSPDPGDPAPRSGGGGRSTADVGRPPADNEVYRAWLSLADAAGANARRDTPEEVVDRAVEAGVDEEAAREITSLFESVRYGDREPNESVEQRAARARSSVAGER